MQLNAPERHIYAVWLAYFGNSEPSHTSSHHELQLPSTVSVAAARVTVPQCEVNSLTVETEFKKGSYEERKYFQERSFEGKTARNSDVDVVNTKQISILILQQISTEQRRRNSHTSTPSSVYPLRIVSFQVLCCEASSLNPYKLAAPSNA